MSQGTQAFRMHMWVQLGDLVPDPGARVLNWVLPLPRGAKSQTQKQKAEATGGWGGRGGDGTRGATVGWVQTFSFARARAFWRWAMVTAAQQHEGT